ncbi:MAG: hypothetical protein J6Q95_02810 [Alistipes sp.]|nr:hypothetical protein [Alistipes sp.]
MRKLFNIFAIAALALGITACEKPAGNEPEVEAKKPALEADKTEIVANGADKVTFTATVDGEANAEIIIISLKDNSVLEDNTFATTTPGTYQFKAVYGNESSDVVEITATEAEKIITLEADKSEIVADATEAVTFTVKVDGAEVTEGYEITNLNYSAALEGNTFTSDVAGEFKFQAKYDGKWLSNEVTITVNNVPVPEHKELKITASPNRIKADGVEEAVFTVMYGEDDVTADAEVFNSLTNEGIESKKFSTTEPGTYKFRARYNGETTGASVEVDAYDPAIAGQYEIGSIYNKDGVKGVIFAIKEHPSSGTIFCYIMSMDEEDLAWSTEYCDLSYANSTWGAWITEDIFDPARDNRDINKYPAFKWCVEHGDGWFLPSQDEMLWMWDAVSGGTHKFDSPTVEKFNKVLSENGGEPFQETYYWSSTAGSADIAIAVAFMENSVVCLTPSRDNAYSVRAAYRFAIN